MFGVFFLCHSSTPGQWSSVCTHVPKRSSHLLNANIRLPESLYCDVGFTPTAQMRTLRPKGAEA